MFLFDDTPRDLRATNPSRPLEPLAGADQLTSGASPCKMSCSHVGFRENALALMASDCIRLQKCLEAEIKRPVLLGLEAALGKELHVPVISAIAQAVVTAATA